MPLGLNRLEAACHFLGDGTPLMEAGCSVVRSAVGDYNITLDQQLDGAELIATVLPLTVDTCFHIVNTSDAIKQVLTKQVAGGGGSWFDVSWGFRKKITVDSSLVPATLTNFPILVNRIDLDWRFTGSGGNVGKVNGGDILFTNSDGTTKLDHEIETYVSTTGELIAWIRLPSLPATPDKEIFIYYGNAAAPDQANPTAVWDANYKGVWHLNETSGNAKDSTVEDTDGVLSGGVTRPAVGQINGAYDFDGIDDGVDMGDPVDGHLDFGSGEFSFSLWASINGSTGSFQQILFKGASSTSDPGYMIELRDTINEINAIIRDGTDDAGARTTFTDNVLTYWVAVVDRTAQLIRLYKNGIQADTDTISLVGSVDNSDTFQVSRATLPADGIIDEVRVSNNARSADWVLTEYRNQNSPATFYAVGAEETAPITDKDAECYVAFWRVAAGDF